MKARMLKHSTTIYAEPDLESVIVAEVSSEMDFDLGQTVKNRGQKWARVTLADGRTGYLPGETTVGFVREMCVDQLVVDVLGAPTVGAPLLRRCHQGDRLIHRGPATQNPDAFVEVRSASGTPGYVLSKTAFKLADDGGLGAAVGVIFFVAFVNLLFGLIGALSGSKTLPGWEAVGAGVAFAVLGVFVSRGSRFALGLAILIWCAELLTRAIAIMVALESSRGRGVPPSIFGLVFSAYMGYMLLKGMWGGFAGINAKRAPAVPVDWNDFSGAQTPRDTVESAGMTGMPSETAGVVAPA